MSAEKDRLKITEIFFSLQGESKTAGLPTVFVRLTGCPLRCTYCDTSYAFSGGHWQSFDEIIEQIRAHDTPYVTVTGGEPMAQPACPRLLTKLCDLGYRVSLETSGAVDLGEVDTRVSKVMDIKTPGSGEQERNDWANLAYLTADDEVKFVICDEADYQWSKRIISEHELAGICELLMSPCHGELAAVELAEWILADELPVRMQIQLHKYLWGDEVGR